MIDVTFDPTLVAVISIGLALGGFLKGATGAGTPLVAIPVMAAFFDVRLAIVVMVVPNILINILQVYQHAPGWRQLRQGGLMSLGALPGVIVGTLLLTRLSDSALSFGLAVVLTVYLLHRVRSPTFLLTDRQFGRLALPVGTVAGFMQGAAGMSGPLALAFLNATRLDRDAFISNISLFFLATSLFQVPPLYAGGLLTGHNLALSTLALAPILVMLPVGNIVGRHLDKVRFGQIVLVTIALLTLRLYWRALAG
jgi:uncharacterized membrane protein YfcA